MLGRTALAVMVLASAACGRPAPDDPDTLVVDGILNPGFEAVADDTTVPPKYGAYWPGAFAPTEGEAWDRIEGDAGGRFLRLAPEHGEVHQKIVADPRWTERLRVELRLAGDGRLEVSLEDGPGRRASAVVEGAGAHALDLGAAFLAEHGERPVPRLNLRLRCLEGSADVDDVHAYVSWPRVAAEGLADSIETRIRRTLELWLEELGLVDPETGYVTRTSYDVETGQLLGKSKSVAFHTIHDLLIRWLRHARERGMDDEVARWTPHVERIARTLVERHFDERTGLPRTVRLESGEPNQHTPVSVGAYIEFLLDAREVIADELLAEQCLRRARTAADTLVRLRTEHDLGPDASNDLKLDPATGVFDGKRDNWFGFMPPKLTPVGEIDTPERFNSAWAILSGRTFWYHLFEAPAAVARVHALAPGNDDLDAIRQVAARYQRDWDAARYDLENDTDDHYGYLSRDGVRILERVPAGSVPDMERLVLGATDHRLARDGALDDALWIQAVRLGAACAGDSPRAFEGVLALMEAGLAPDAHELYRGAIRELAWNDFKGRQLTNGQFTESFFKSWEMVCICYRGTYQGDCREQPADYWHGDVGDLFGGPPAKSIEALTHAYRVADDAGREQILAALGVIDHVTETTMARPFGYLFGLDPAIARQYELPEKYTLGLSSKTTAGLGTIMAWMRLLPHLD